MSLNLPVVSTTAGPDWATSINTALTTIDSHDHSDGAGNAITQAGISLTGSLDFSDETATNLGACTFTNLTANIATAVSLYVKSGELYYNDNSSNQIRITSGGALDVSSVAGIGGDYASTAATVFYTDGVLTYFFEDSAGNKALIDGTFKTTFTTYSSAQTLAQGTDDLVLVSGNTTLTLPAVASSSGLKFTIKKTDSNSTTVTLDGNLSETIDGSTTYDIIEQYTTVTVACDGTAWYII